MAMFKKNNRWWVDIYVNGMRIRKPVSTSKKEAEKVLIKMKSDTLHRKYALPKDEKVRFSDFARIYIERVSVPGKRSYLTDISLLKNLIVYFGDLYLHEICDYHYEQYRNIRIKQKVKNKNKLVSTTTINREGALLRAMLNKAVQWGVLSFNPIKKMSMFKEEPKERILTEKEIKLLVRSAEVPLKHIILVALNTGMRRGEILNLHWNQVNVDQGFITVQKTKSRKLRRIPLNRSMKRLFSHLYLNRGGRGYVFENPDTGQPLQDIKTAWYSLLRRTGIKDFRFHDLRHCFATYTLLNGGDLISLKETLGHDDIATTSRYTKALLEGQQKLVNSFEVDEDGGEMIDFPERKIKTS
jgi:integrase